MSKLQPGFNDLATPIFNSNRCINKRSGDRLFQNRTLLLMNKNTERILSYNSVKISQKQETPIS